MEHIPVVINYLGIQSAQLALSISSDKLALVVFALLASMMLAVLLTPVAMKLAVKAGVLDQPGHRRVHTSPTPRWGGLAMLAAFIVTVLALTPLRANLLGENMLNQRVLGILIGGVLITLIGALDDKYNVPAKIKLLGQIVAASVLPLFGVTMVVAFNVNIEGWLGALLTVIWVVGITNTINLIDGLDGLAAGVSGLVALSFVIIGVFIRGTLGEAMLAAALAGACIGFLRYNFNPAKVFMGDAGSHFLGYTIGALSILQNWKVATGVAFVVPVLILAVPILDTAAAVIRRLVRRQPIFSADKEHLHHRLLDLGLNQRAVVVTIYLLVIVGCSLAIWLARFRLWE